MSHEDLREYLRAVHDACEAIAKAKTAIDHNDFREYQRQYETAAALMELLTLLNAHVTRKKPDSPATLY